MELASAFTVFAIMVLSFWGSVIVAEDQESINVSVVLKNGGSDLLDVFCKFAPGDEAVAGGTRPLRGGEKMDIDFRASTFSRESLICAFHLLGINEQKYVEVPIWLSPLDHGDLCDTWKYKCSNVCTWDMFEDGLYVLVDGIAHKCREWAP